jgi:ABC-type lipoprotein release transport system permease subunit
MGAVWILARAEIRRRWRSAVVMTLLVGVVGAVVLATAAGARRSNTALARFNTVSRPEDVALLPSPAGYTPTTVQLRAVRHVHDVTAIAVVRFYTLVPRGAAATLGVGGMGAAVDGAMGSIVDRYRVVAGRAPNPSTADEITIGEGLAARLHLGVGGQIEASSYSAAQIQAALANGDTGGPPPSALGPQVRFRVVGIVRRPFDLGDLGARGADEGVVVLTPAFNRAYVDRIGNLGVVLFIRTSHGASDVPSVAAAARRIFRTSGGVSTQAVTSLGAKDAIDVLTLTLWIFAGVAALAGAVTIGIVLTREISLTSVDQPTLHALGLTRAQYVLARGPRVLLVAGAGVLFALLGAVAASPLLPIGVARRADPDVGLHFDCVVLALGALAVLGFVVGIAFLAAWRNSRQSAHAARLDTRQRASSVAATAARAGLSPTVTSGLRMALEPGRGRTAVPVRSAYLGAVFGVLGVTAVLGFGSSLNHLVTTPRLYGSTWDFQASDTNFDSGAAHPCTRDDLGLTRVPGVASVTAVCDDDVQLGGHPVSGWGFTPVRGAIGPEIVSGRAPRGPGEVALGSVTLDTLGKHVGDTVQGRGPNKTTEYRIVGRAVFPTIAGKPLADGAAFTGAGLSNIFDSNSSSSRYLLGRFAPGSDRVEVEQRIDALPALGRAAGPTLPVEIDRVRQVDWLPATLAVLVGGLALLAIGHALVTAIRRRRRELALLKTLGFERRQVRATIAWQATTLAAVGLVVGIPAGLIVGRVVWRLVGDGLGVSTHASMPALALILIVPVALALVNLLALLPARSAARTRPAVALRSE